MYYNHKTSNTTKDPTQVRKTKQKIVAKKVLDIFSCISKYEMKKSLVISQAN